MDDETKSSLKEISGTITELRDTQHEINKTLALQAQTMQFQAESLAEHIRRTNLLEGKVDRVEDHVEFIQKLMKLLPWALGIVATSLAIAAGLSDIL